MAVKFKILTPTRVIIRIKSTLRSDDGGSKLL